MYQIVVTGEYRRSSRRLAAYLGPVPLLPTMESAFATQDPNLTVELPGTVRISGLNKNIDGTLAGGGDLPGLSTAPPGTVAQLSSELTGSEPGKVVGSTPSPSLAVSAPIDVPTLVAQVANIADLVLTNSNYASYDFGDGAAGVATIAYRDGDVTFGGNTTGAGILVVTGDLQLKGNFRYDGVIIVLGEVSNSAGTSQVYGSILQGPNGGVLDLRGTVDLHYSAEAINLANSISGQYVAFNGWQELSN